MSDDHVALTALLASGHVTPATREVLEGRLSARFQRNFFSPEEALLLRAVALRLVPHDPAAMDLTGCVDERLALGKTDGWRYADSPPDPLAYRALLASLPQDFAELDPGVQDELLRQAQRAHPHPFEDLLAELAEGYYSHPLVQVGLGYAGFADAPGWERIGLNEAEEREPSAPGPRP